MSGANGANGTLSAPRPRPALKRALRGEQRPADFHESMVNGRRRREELNYRAAQSSRYRSNTTSLGGTADAHYALGLDYWLIRELVREYDRNDPNVGQLVERALDNVLGAGLVVDPQTGISKDLDQQLKGGWDDWANNPALCDYTGRFTFDEIERMALRQTWIDGDCFVVLDDRLEALLLEEGDRVTSWKDSSKDVVHGVELDGRRRPVRYYFQRLAPGERTRHTRMLVSGDLVALDAESVIHVYYPRRSTQSRGVSPFAAVATLIPLHGDTEFARAVKAEVSALVAAFVTTPSVVDPWHGHGRDTETSELDADTELDLVELVPGTIKRLPVGADIRGFNPGITTSDDAEFSKGLLRTIGLQIGLPLELGRLSAEDTSFSGYRGVVEQYKITARTLQARFRRLLRSRVYAWRVRRMVELGLVPDDPRVYRHRILTPTWPYIEPETDARADTLRLEKRLASARQLASERGLDYDALVVENAEDDAAQIVEWHKAAQKLDAAGIKGVTWETLRDLRASKASKESVAPQAQAPSGTGKAAA